MVRRRTTKASAAVTAGSKSKRQEKNDADGVVANSIFNEQGFASPKKKDVKTDKSSKLESFETDATLKSEIKNGLGRNNLGCTNGMPLTTRSQTRTIENFFKSTHAMKALKESNDTKFWESPMKLSESGLCDITYQRKIHRLTNELMYELSEDTNDTDNTELSEDMVKCGEFVVHRSSLSDRHSSRSSISASNVENIFLQEPVLTLNVDKTLNQASSIKINTSLETEPVFSSPPILTTAAFDGRFNQIVSLNCSLVEQNDDDSSCDSGIAFAALYGKSNSSIMQNDDPSIGIAIRSRRRKPTTPHRIVCPSPVKSASRIVNSSCVTARVAASGPKNNEQVSPRKSQRQIPNTNKKARRRLNHSEEASLALSSEKEEDNKQNGPVNVLDIVPNTEQEDIEFGNVNVTDSLGLFSEPWKNAALRKTRARSMTKNQTKVKTQTQKNLPKTKSTRPFPLIAANGNRALTEFFPVRRSVRKTKSVVKEEMMRNLEQAILEERSDGLKIAYFEGKGRGIVADRRFQRGEFVVEYVGDLITMSEAAEREKCYALDENAGCYMYYFKHKNQQYCIDATIDTGKLGRLVNHSRNGNLLTKVVVVKQRPHLVLIAKDNIEPGEELTYDYGDRSKESLLHHPWLAF